MRLLSFLTTAALCLAIWAVSTAEGQDPGSPAPRTPPPPPRGLLRRWVEQRQRALDKDKGKDKGHDDARTLEDFQKKQELDAEQLAKARREVDERFKQFQAKGDRRAYRDWRDAYDRYARQQREYDAAVLRFWGRWQREHPGVAPPPLAGAAGSGGPPGYGAPPDGGAPPDYPRLFRLRPPPPKSPTPPASGAPPSGPVFPSVPPPPEPVPAIPEPGETPLSADPVTPGPSEKPAPPSTPSGPHEL
jgi:hypothetical protein